MQRETIFKDLVVIELACALAGPSVGMFFAELGAKVIKVENKTTDGDITRRWKLPSEDAEDSYSSYYYSVNWGKKSIYLSLRNQEDRAKVYQLVKEADIVISNFKFGSAQKLGMDYNSLKEVNKSIIFGNVYAYDEDDPRPGFDAALQAETGWMFMNGHEDGPPTKVPLPIIDILAGHQLKEGILVALIHRLKTGEGCNIGVSLYDSSVSAMTNQASSYLNLGIIPQRSGSKHPSIAPYGDVVNTSDGVSYLLAVGTEDHFKSLCRAISNDKLMNDDRFLNNKLRLQNRDDLISIIQESTTKMTAARFESECDRFGVPLGPVRSLEQLFNEEDGQELILEEKLEDGRISKCVKTAVFKFLN